MALLSARIDYGTISAGAVKSSFPLVLFCSNYKNSKFSQEEVSLIYIYGMRTKNFSSYNIKSSLFHSLFSIMGAPSEKSEV